MNKGSGPVNISPIWRQEGHPATQKSGTQCPQDQWKLANPDSTGKLPLTW